MLSAVVDSNVIVGGVISRSEKSANIRVLNAILSREFEYVASNEILDELMRVLKLSSSMVKHKQSSAEIDRLYERLHVFCRILESPRHVSHALTRDVTDTKFLDLAVTANADFLVTYDHQHLLRLKKIGVTRIVTPHKFMLALKYSLGHR